MVHPSTTQSNIEKGTFAHADAESETTEGSIDDALMMNEDGKTDCLGSSKDCEKHGQEIYEEVIGKTVSEKVSSTSQQIKSMEDTEAPREDMFSILLKAVTPLNSTTNYPTTSFGDPFPSSFKKRVEEDEKELSASSEKSIYLHNQSKSDLQKKIEASAKSIQDRVERGALRSSLKSDRRDETDRIQAEYLKVDNPDGDDRALNALLHKRHQMREERIEKVYKEQVSFESKRALEIQKVKKLEEDAKNKLRQKSEALDKKVIAAHQEMQRKDAEQRRVMDVRMRALRQKKAYQDRQIAIQREKTMNKRREAEKKYTT